MNNRFRNMVSKGDYSKQEILANLVPVLNEIKEEIEREYGL